MTGNVLCRNAIQGEVPGSVAGALCLLSATVIFLTLPRDCCQSDAANGSLQRHVSANYSWPHFLDSDDYRTWPRLWRGRSRSFGNQPRTSLSRQIGPEPLVLNAEPVLKLRQREHMQGGPHQPRQKAAGAQMASL